MTTEQQKPGANLSLKATKPMLQYPKDIGFFVCIDQELAENCSCAEHLNN